MQLACLALECRACWMAQGCRRLSSLGDSGACDQGGDLLLLAQVEEHFVPGAFHEDVPYCVDKQHLRFWIEGHARLNGLGPAQGWQDLQVGRARLLLHWTGVGRVPAPCLALEREHPTLVFRDALELDADLERPGDVSADQGHTWPWNARGGYHGAPCCWRRRIALTTKAKTWHEEKHGAVRYLVGGQRPRIEHRSAIASESLHLHWRALRFGESLLHLANGISGQHLELH